MIERAARDLRVLPARRVVARFAARRECSVMWILVASGARLEIQAFILDYLGVFLRGLMALGALEILVLACQRKMRARVVKLFDRLPGRKPVTRLAIRAQLAVVVVFMTRETGRVEPFKRLRQIVNHDGLPIRRRDVFGVMAFFAFQLRMLAN